MKPMTYKETQRQYTSPSITGADELAIQGARTTGKIVLGNISITQSTPTTQNQNKSIQRRGLDTKYTQYLFLPTKLVDMLTAGADGPRFPFWEIISPFAPCENVTAHSRVGIFSVFSSSTGQLVCYRISLPVKKWYVYFH